MFQDDVPTGPQPSPLDVDPPPADVFYDASGEEEEDDALTLSPLDADPPPDDVDYDASGEEETEEEEEEFFDCIEGVSFL